MSEPRYLITICLSMPVNGVKKGGAIQKVSLSGVIPFVPVQGMVFHTQGRYVGESAKVRFTSIPEWKQFRDCHGIFIIAADATPSPTKSFAKIMEVFTKTGWQVHVVKK